MPESRVEFLSDLDELHATWTRFDPHRDGATPHVHRQHNDLFYVLAGELTVLVGPERTETPLRAGTIVLAPPLVVHGFRNAADEELRYLNFHAPGGTCTHDPAVARSSLPFTVNVSSPART